MERVDYDLKNRKRSETVREHKFQVYLPAGCDLQEGGDRGTGFQFDGRLNPTFPINIVISYFLNI